MRFVALFVVALGGVAAASPRDWAGSAACGKCHPAELAAWQTTRHAMTRDRFPEREASPKGDKPAAKCLACHGTGEAPAGTAIAVEVGCEACHGAGAAYAADDIMRTPFVAQALGLVDLSNAKARTALCMQCHATRMNAKFDLKAPVHAVKK